MARHRAALSSHEARPAGAPAIADAHLGQLTPAERAAAREHYKSLRQLPPDKKDAVRQKWEQYQTLPPERREALGKSAPTRGGARTPARTPMPVATTPGAPAAASRTPAAAARGPPTSPVNPASRRTR